MYNEEIKKIDDEIKEIEIKLFEEEKKKTQFESADSTNYKSVEIIYNELTDTISNIEKYKKEIEKKKSAKFEHLNKIKAEENIIENINKDISEEEKFVKEETEKLINDLKQKDKEKKEIYKKLPKDIVEKFERIMVNKKLRGIVPIHENSCSGCNIILPIDFINKVKLNKTIVFCPYCSRVLYDEEKVSFSK